MLKLRASPILHILLLHIGFHTFWVLVYLASLAGSFILIPLIGWYATFVLGFIAFVGSASVTVAMIGGFVPFALSGVFSGWFVSQLKPKVVWPAGILSLALTVAILFSASLTTIKLRQRGIYKEVDAAATTGNQAALDLSLYLKAAYHQTEPPSPPYVSGREPVIPLKELQPMLLALSKDFKLSDDGYFYCNLSPRVWNSLRRRNGRSGYPLAWKAMADASGRRLVIIVNLKDDAFVDAAMAEDSLVARLRAMEATVREASGDNGSSLDLRGRP
jgi:hypothetical protein